MSPTPKPHDAKDGTRTWKVRFREDGRSSSITFTTEHDARRFARDIENHDVPTALRILDARETSTSSPTLDDVFARYAEWKAARVRSDRTTADDRRDWRLAVKPHLGGRPIDDVTQADVQAWVDRLHRGDGCRKLAPKTIQHRHALLAAVYRWANSPGQGITANQPTAETDLPRVRKPPPKGLRPPEWVALHRALTQIDADAADLAAFAVATGARWSEATALLPLDVEDDGATVHVTIGAVMRRNGKNRFERVVDTKSEAGHRRIRLDAATAELVRRRIGAVPDHARPVFCTSRGLPWRYSHYRDRAWEPAVRAANLTRHPTFHWLRHSHVLWLVAAGATLPELQARIGHASIGTTINVYGRAISDVQAAPLDALAGILGAPPPPALSQ